MRVYLARATPATVLSEAVTRAARPRLRPTRVVPATGAVTATALALTLGPLGCAASVEKAAWPFPPKVEVAAGAQLDSTGRATRRLASGSEQGGGLEDDGEGVPDGAGSEPGPSLLGEAQSQRPPMFRWPLTTTGINSLYGERIDPIDGKRRFHAGIDIAASYGALVSAAAPGVVQHADWTHGHGRQVVIEHNGGFRTIYSHLAQVLVLPGSVVQAGTVIGQVGNSGRSTGAHLHFAVTHWNNPIDPLEVLAEP